MQLLVIGIGMSSPAHLTAEAADTAKAAHGGWHSPRTDRREEATRARLWRDGFDPAESVEAFRRDLDAAIWTRLLDETGLRRIMDAQERETMDRALQEDVPPATADAEAAAGGNYSSGEAEVSDTSGGTLASDEALAALRAKLAGGE